MLKLNLDVVTSNNFVFYRFDSDEAYYLGEKEEVSLVGVLSDLSAFLVIFSYIVPISLYTTLGKSHVDLPTVLTDSYFNLLLFRGAKIYEQSIFWMGP